jgi:hypothetical protein
VGFVTQQNDGEWEREQMRHAGIRKTVQYFEEGVLRGAVTVTCSTQRPVKRKYFWYFFHKILYQHKTEPIFSFDSLTRAQCLQRGYSTGQTKNRKNTVPVTVLKLSVKEKISNTQFVFLLDKRKIRQQHSIDTMPAFSAPAARGSRGRARRSACSSTSAS